MSVSWESSIAGNAELTVFDARGNILYTQKIQVSIGNNQRNIPLKNINNGTYTLTLKLSNDTRQAQLIIEK